MSHIVLLNKIKALLAENCEGTTPFDGLDYPIGLTLAQICREFDDINQEEVEFLLNLETQTFYFDRKMSRWKIFPKIVDLIIADIHEREKLMKQVWKNTNISKFVSYDDYYQLLYLRKVDFTSVIDRCKKIGSCNPEILRLPSDEIWNSILFASDKEFNVRFSLMQMNVPSFLKDLDKFKIALSAYAFVQNPIQDKNDEEETEIRDSAESSDYDEKGKVPSDNNHNYFDQNYNRYDYSDELDTAEWNLESILRQEGYTVSQKEDLSDGERQNILKSVLIRGLMTKWAIIEHIELQISLRKNKPMYAVAISKWERDLKYIRTHF